MKKFNSLLVAIFIIVMSIFVGGCSGNTKESTASVNSEETIVSTGNGKYSSDTVDAFNRLHGSWGDRRDNMEVGVHETDDGHYAMNIWTDGNELFEGNCTIVITDIELVSGKYLVHGLLDDEEVSYTLNRDNQVLYFEDIALNMNMVE